jgi:hypothetical protein
MICEMNISKEISFMVPMITSEYTRINFAKYKTVPQRRGRGWANMYTLATGSGFSFLSCRIKALWLGKNIPKKTIEQKDSVIYFRIVGG